MIEIINAQTLEGTVKSFAVPSHENVTIDATGLTLLPGLIDPHVHFRTPGLEHKENWQTGARAAIAGGITTVFDMPNTLPATITHKRVLEKKEIIENQLKEADIPLRYGLYLGADKKEFAQIAQAKSEVVGIKVFMGSSTGELLVDDEESLHTAFQCAAHNDLLLAIHAEDEQILRKQKALFKGENHPRIHSKLRSREAAYAATKKALDLAELYRTRLYLLHIGTKEEVELIKNAKKRGVLVFAETCINHLFLTEELYETLGTKVQMNPPIRAQEDIECLWKAIGDGTIDTIGSDHAPHTLEEKKQPYGVAPSGIPGVETTLPLLLNAMHEGRLTLSQIVKLMHDKILEIFRLPPNEDFILVDLSREKHIEEKSLRTNVRWSPYSSWKLKGWPIYTVVQGRIYGPHL